VSSGRIAGTSRGRNLTALGGFAAVYGVAPEAFIKVITAKFESKGSKVVDANTKSFTAGYEHAQQVYSDRMRNLFSGIGGGGVDKVMLSGNVAVGQAAIDAGLKLYFGYPITPATPIMEYLAKALPDAGGTLPQFQDFAELVERVHSWHDQLHRMIVDGVRQRQVRDADTSSLLNVNRELLNSNIAMLMSLTAFHLEPAETEAFRQLPGTA